MKASGEEGIPTRLMKNCASETLTFVEPKWANEMMTRGAAGNQTQLRLHRRSAGLGIGEYGGCGTRYV